MSTDPTNRLSPDRELKLARLPSLEPPRDVLPQVLAEVRRRRRPRWRLRNGLKWAAAAALVASLGVIALLAGRVERQADELAEWVAYSQQLEARLRLVGGSSQVVRGHRAAALDALEDQLAWIDRRLASRTRPADELQLWRRRALLLHDLVSVRAGERADTGPESRRPVVTINRPPGAIPATYEI